MAPPQVGDQVPDVVLYENQPGNKVHLRDLFAGKKGVLFALPGAFTPNCSKTHLPGYLADYDKFKEAGCDVLACVSVNDPFVMEAWGKANQADGKVRMLADMHMDLTKAWDVVLDAEANLGNKRSKRYSVVIQDNVIKAFNLEEVGQLSCSLSNPTLEQLKALA